jgi:glutaredoxin-related protein
MNPFVYRDGSVQHYVNITESGASNEDFLRILDGLNQFRHAKMQQQLLPTSSANVANVKCVFIAENSRQMAGVQKHNFSGVRELMTDFFRVLGQDANRRPRSHLPTHTVAAFYDTSGELWQKAIVATTLNVLANVHVQAVVVDMAACKCFNPSSTSASSSVALEQLQRPRPGPQTRRCLVVTKLDRVPQMRSYIDVVKTAKSPTPDPRELLHYLASSPSTLERRLWQRIDQDQELAIFPVWTEGLEAPGTEVRSYGVEGFVNWCRLLGTNQQPPPR